MSQWNSVCVRGNEGTCHSVQQWGSLMFLLIVFRQQWSSWLWTHTHILVSRKHSLLVWLCTWDLLTIRENTSSKWNSWLCCDKYAVTFSSRVTCEATYLALSLCCCVHSNLRWKTASAESSTLKWKWNIIDVRLQEEEAISSLFTYQMRHASQDASFFQVQLSSSRRGSVCPSRGRSVNPSLYNFSIDFSLLEPLGGFHFPGTGVFMRTLNWPFTSKKKSQLAVSVNAQWDVIVCLCVQWAGR